MKTRHSDKHAQRVVNAGRRKKSPHPRRQKALRGWDAIEALVGTVEGPKDWVWEQDHYLRATPKHGKASKQ